MQQKLENLLLTSCGEPVQGVYQGKRQVNQSQAEEILLRQLVAQQVYTDYLAEIGKHHSIHVMDNEVDRFLKKIPVNGLILDIGGCWGWHWRDIAQKRPDINILIIDFVAANLVHAKNILGSLIGSQVALMDADATNLPFKLSDKFNGFDGVWTVQTFQHIPDFSKAVKEVQRVLCKGGYFINYSLHKTPLNRFVYFMLRKKYHVEGEMHGSFYLSRANKQQKKVIEKAFHSKVHVRYTECLFQPDFGVICTGKKSSFLGSVDSLLGNFPWLGYWIARQQSYALTK